MSDKLQMQSVRGFLTANSLQRLNCYREGCLCGESRAFSREKIINAQLQILLSVPQSETLPTGLQSSTVKDATPHLLLKAAREGHSHTLQAFRRQKVCWPQRPQSSVTISKSPPNKAKKLDSLISSYHQCMLGAVIFNYFINHQGSLSA